MNKCTHLPDIDSAARLAAHAFARRDAHAILFARPLVQWQREMRTHLDLPTDAPIIVTGHQAGIWHAGIAEKFSYGAALARKLGGVLVHVVVDHDRNDASEISFPAEIEGKLARLRLERTPRGRGVNALRAPIRVRMPDAVLEHNARVLPQVMDALSRIESAVNACATQPNLALQMAHAANELLPAPYRPFRTISATSIARTPFARAMRTHFDQRARACYNASLEHTRIHRLTSTELPFWRLLQNSPDRAPLGTGEDDALAAPRAMTLTALVRLTLCDLFVHGNGGAVYERATDDWLDAWLGGHVPRAPIAVATATRLIDGLQANLAIESPRITKAQLRRFRFDPFGAPLSAQKQALLAEIAAIPREQRSARRDAYLRMQSAVDAALRAHASHLTQLESLSLQRLADEEERAFAHDRTWPFPMTMCNAMPLSDHASGSGR